MVFRRVLFRSIVKRLESVAHSPRCGDVFRRLVKLASPGEVPRVVVVGHRVLRAEALRRQIALNGTPVVSSLAVNVGAVAVGPRQIWIETNRLVELRQGSVLVAEIGIDYAAKIVSAGQVSPAVALVDDLGAGRQSGLAPVAKIGRAHV